MAYSIQIVNVGTFTDSAIEMGSINFTTAIDIIGAELAADVFDAKIDFGSTDISAVQYGTPLRLYNDSSLLGKFYVRRIVRVGLTMYKLTAMSAIGFLENLKHYGDLYENVTADDLIAEIIDGAFSYSIDPAVATQPVLGWLPVDSRRNNLHKLLFALGITITKDTNGDINFVFLQTDSYTNVPNSRIYLGSEIEYPEGATMVEVAEHTFYKTDNDLEEQLFDNVNKVAASNAIVEFDGPHYDLTTTGTLTITESGVNYAIVSGNGILSGKPYTHNIRLVQKSAVSSGPVENVITADDDTLINAMNSENVATRLMAYYTSKHVVRADIILNEEKCGDVVHFENAFGESDSGIITQMSAVASSFIKAAANIVTGYTPVGQGNYYAQKAVITSSGSWTVPSGVKKVRMVLIAPGSGGGGGYDGEDGDEPESITTQYWGGKDYPSGEQRTPRGGAGGVAGAQGKIYIAEYDTDGGETFNISIGSAGAGGARNGGNGAAGGDTSVSGFKTASANTNGTLVNGYLEPFSGEVYALPGKDGIKGGDGGTIQTTEEFPASGTYRTSGADGNPGGDAENYHGGDGGDGTHGNYTASDTYYASGGGGGGAAKGANGSDGGDAAYGEEQVQGGMVYYVQSGNGGNGANASAPPAVKYGCGGHGGHGGGAGGNAGSNRKNIDTSTSEHLNLRYGTKGLGGTGTAGANGGGGAALFYYSAPGGGGGGGGGSSWNVQNFSTPEYLDDTFISFGISQVTNIGAFILYRTGNMSATSGAIQAILHDSTGDTVWYVDGNGNARKTSVTGIVLDTQYGGVIVDVTHASISGLVYKDANYGLILVSGGSGSLTWRTKTLTPSTSNTLSIAFTQLEAEPALFMCGIGDNVASAVSRKVQTIQKWSTVFCGTNFYKGFGASTPNTQYFTTFTQSYSNGTLTLTSPSGQQNGYFTNGVTHTLAYLTAADIS